MNRSNSLSYKLSAEVRMRCVVECRVLIIDVNDRHAIAHWHDIKYVNVTCVMFSCRESVQVVEVTNSVSCFIRRAEDAVLSGRFAFRLSNLLTSE